MGGPKTGESHFPQSNHSCMRLTLSPAETTLIYILPSIIMLITVVLNLLVIVSIAHFRQLQTTTNLLLLSLAVTDFLMGLLVMPPHVVFWMDSCRYMCDILCVVQTFFSFVIVSASVGSMVLISVDRYVAICQPMLYSSRVTLSRVKLSVCLCWISSVVHSSWTLRHFLQDPDMQRACFECSAVVKFAEGIVDLVVTFAAPILVIVLLYLRVFVVAVSQARAMRSRAPLKRSKTVKAEKSEVKAARTLGIVVLVFLICCCPYYILTLVPQSLLFGDMSMSLSIAIWFMYLNSTFNPIIYVFFYPWFRKTIKHIFTLQILKAGSHEAAIL